MSIITLPRIRVNALTESGKVEVPENSQIGTFVAHVDIDDADEGINGWIHVCLNWSKIWTWTTVQNHIQNKNQNYIWSGKPCLSMLFILSVKIMVRLLWDPAKKFP